MKKSHALLLLFIPLAFFLVGLITLNDYGISWDEPIHFRRGQAYLRFLTTGEKDYQNFQGRRSYFQSDIQNANYFLIDDGGHPPVNDILSALTNFIFYQKLGLFGDIESYHLFNLLTSTLAILVVGVFAFQASNWQTAMSSQVILATYPLFFAESRFNIKDPPQSAFFALSIFCFWMSLKKWSWKWVILSALSFALSFGMKFNILFAPFIILPYLLTQFLPKYKKFKIPKAYWFAVLVSPVIILFIFFASWPYLWQDAIGNFLKVVNFYRELGTGFDYQPGYYFWKFNLYPIYWIVITTYPIVLILMTVGIVMVLKDRGRDKTSLLWLFWFLAPILRVTVPGASIYGGVRQIMEFIPAMALLSGLGAYFLILRLSLNVRKSLFVLLLPFFVWPLVKYHPNQNVYFNFLIGGLRGASEKNIPYWGNSFGNAYAQAVKWLNENAEEEARLALIQGTMTNIPTIQLRGDIDFSNLNWSGILQKGEYLVELTHDDPVRLYPYAWEYVENFLIPVYEVKVDDVVIAKVWKNDQEHVVDSLRQNEKRYEFVPTREVNTLVVDLSESKIITRVYVGYDEDRVCSGKSARVELSKDGQAWFVEPENIPANQLINYEEIKNAIPLFIAGHEARFVRVTPDNPNSCFFEGHKIYVSALE